MQFVVRWWLKGHGQSLAHRLIEARGRFGEQGEVEELAIVEEVRPLSIPVIEEARVESIVVRNRG